MRPLGLLLIALWLSGATADPGLDAAEQAIRAGAGSLRLAARSGEPELLREAERDLLEGLFAGLEACVVDGRVDAGRFERLRLAIEEAKGLFKGLPHQLVVQGPTELVLPLRRSPWPRLQARPLAHWRAEAGESAVILRLRLSGD